MSDPPRLRFWKVLGLSESFKLSQRQSLKHHISALWLLLPGTAIALVSFLTITNSACGCGDGSGEGKAFVGALQRAQQAYFIEHHSLATSLETLKIGLPTETQNYQIQIRVTETAAFHFAIPKVARVNDTISIDQFPITKVQSKHPLPGYVSAVFVLPTTPKSFQTILCQTDASGRVQLNEPILRNGVPTCAPGTHPL
jgi:type IV pilus assembly protein PilA